MAESALSERAFFEWKGEINSRLDSIIKHLERLNGSVGSNADRIAQVEKDVWQQEVYQRNQGKEIDEAEDALDEVSDRVTNLRVRLGTLVGIALGGGVFGAAATKALEALAL